MEARYAAGINTSTSPRPADDAVGLVDRLLSKMTTATSPISTPTSSSSPSSSRTSSQPKEERSTLQDQLFGRFIEMLQVLTLPPSRTSRSPLLILAGHFYVHPIPETSGVHQWLRARNEWKVLTFQRVKPPYPKPRPPSKKKLTPSARTLP